MSIHSNAPLYIPFLDVLEFMEDMDADSLTNKLQPTYHELLGRLRDLFPSYYQDDQDDGTEDEDRSFEEEENDDDGGENQRHFSYEGDDAGDDEPFATVQVRHKHSNQFDEGDIYDESTTNEDYEQFSFFGKWLFGCFWCGYCYSFV